jgi:hypothetical protein
MPLRSIPAAQIGHWALGPRAIEQVLIAIRRGLLGVFKGWARSI